MNEFAINFVELIIKAVRAYLFTGAIFSAFFVIFGIHRLDPGARGWTIGFRIMIFPGLCVFYPLFAIRWLRGKTKPTERNAHRIAAMDLPNT